MIVGGSSQSGVLLPDREPRVSILDFDLGRVFWSWGCELLLFFAGTWEWGARVQLRLGARIKISTLSIESGCV